MYNFICWATKRGKYCFSLEKKFFYLPFLQYSTVFSIDTEYIGLKISCVIQQFPVCLCCECYYYLEFTCFNL